MSTSLAAPPFAEDQLALVRRLLADATAEQRHWLAGYVAGFSEAAQKQPAAAPAVAPRLPLTILYASESGNAEALAGAARKTAARLGFSPRVLDMADTTPADIARAQNLLVIAATWGEGDPPQRAEAFHAGLLADDAPRFDGVQYAVLALGDRAYARFCETGRQFDERFWALGGKRIAERVECDLDYKPAAKAWTESALRGLAEQAEGRTPNAPSSWPAQAGHPRLSFGEHGQGVDSRPEPVVGRAESPPRLPAATEEAGIIHVDFARNVAEGDDTDDAQRSVPAEVTAQINLNSSRSDVETFHVELSLAGAGLSYEPGDSIGFVPENDPALVEEIARIAGLSGDAALADALTRRLDITTLTRTQIGQYATLTADATLQALAEDAARAQNFVRDRQFVDLLAAAPKHLEPEQLVSLLRPLPARLYSVASSQAAVGDEAHLLIARVQWESHGRTRKGVASNQVADRVGVGGTLPISVKRNPHFRLPADAGAPVIMIGPGTGVAPFRAFLQQREATGAAGRNWLFFGARRFTHDFLYQLEWQEWLASGVLHRIDLAFSRDQGAKIYVQHRMWEARRELYAWLQDGGYLYVCGDAKAMAKDVHAMLLRVIADQSGRDADGAAAYLRGLQQAGRYLRDVY